MYKRVNGVRVRVSSEEEAVILEERRLATIEQSKRLYIRRRQEEYPNIRDQLDMLFKAMRSGEIPKATEWFDTIEQIKTNHPKPVDTARKV